MFAVHVTGAGGLGFDDDAGGDMLQLNGRVGFVLPEALKLVCDCDGNRRGKEV